MINNIKLIYCLDSQYFNKLYTIAREICNFKVDANNYKYDLVLPQENKVKLMNYQPNPKNRTKRSKLFSIKKSRVLKSKMNENDFGEMDVEENDNRMMLKDYLARRNLSN